MASEVKYVIRNLKDGKFFRAPDTWVVLLDEATDVTGPVEALNHVAGLDLNGLEVLVVKDGRAGMGFHLGKLAADWKSQ